MADLRLRTDSRGKARRHSLLLPSEYSSAGEGKGGRKRSLLGFLRDRPWKRKTHSTSSLEKNRPTSPLDSPEEEKDGYIRVMAAVLHPEMHHKTLLPITPDTTAQDVIVTMVNQHATSTEDQNPDAFYLAETKESGQGSYSRVLDGGDRVHEIQKRWTDLKNSWFTLCRAPKIVHEDPFLGSTLGASLLSGGSNDCMHMVLVEEGYSGSSSDILNDPYFESSRTFTENNSTLTNFDSDSMLDCDNMVGHSAMVGDAMMVGHPTTVGHTVMSGYSLSGSHDDCRSPDSPLSSSLHSCSTESTTPSEFVNNAANSPTNTDSTIFSGTGTHIRRRFSSPASCGFSVDTGTNRKGRKTATHVHFDNQTAQQNTTTVAIETDNVEPNRLLEKHRLLMRQSISQGMSAIMNRVVSERRQRALPSDARQPQSNSNVTIATAKKETVMLPLHSVETKSLQLVPSHTGAQERGNEERDGGDWEFMEEDEDKEDDEDNSRRNWKGGEEGRSEEEEEGKEEEQEGGEEERKEEGGREDGGCGEGVNEVEGSELLTGDCDHHEPQRMGLMDKEGTPHVQDDQEASNEGDSKSSGVLPSHGVSSFDVRESTPLECSQQNLLQSYFKTSKVVLFQTELTVYPTFQAHASLYPSFLHCDYFSSEMDIFQSLSTLLETKFSKTVRGPASSEDKQNWSSPDGSALSPKKGRQNPDHKDHPSPPPPHASLISPSRRSRLIDQATKAVKLKYSFNDCPTSLDNIALLSSTHDNAPRTERGDEADTDAHNSFPVEELPANFEFHQRQESFSDSCGGHSSVETLSSTTPSGSQGSVEKTLSNTQPSRQYSGSSSPVILPYYQKSLPSSPHNLYPPSSLVHSQKSLSYLSVLQHNGGQAANRKLYPLADIALHQTFRSTEVLNTETHREVLCTFGSFRRPLTVLMSNQSKSTLSLSNPWSPSNLWSPSNQTVMGQHHPVFHSTQNLPVTK